MTPKTHLQNKIMHGLVVLIASIVFVGCQERSGSSENQSLYDTNLSGLSAQSSGQANLSSLSTRETTDINDFINDPNLPSQQPTSPQPSNPTLTEPPANASPLPQPVVTSPVPEVPPAPAPAPISSPIVTQPEPVVVVPTPTPVIPIPVVVAPAPMPVVETPAPVVVAPAPVVETPAPVVVPPAPVVVAPEPPPDRLAYLQGGDIVVNFKVRLTYAGRINVKYENGRVRLDQLMTMSPTSTNTCYLQNPGDICQPKIVYAEVGGASYAREIVQNRFSNGVSGADFFVQLNTAQSGWATTAVLNNDYSITFYYYQSGISAAINRSTFEGYKAYGRGTLGIQERQSLPDGRNFYAQEGIVENY